MSVEQPMVVRFLAPEARMSMNHRLHWRAQRRIARGWRQAAHVHALAQLGAGPAARRRPACFVRVSFPVDDPGRRRDPHNLAPTVKAIVDGLVDAGVWSDDDEQWVTVLDPRFYKPDHGRAVNADVVVALIPRAGAIPE